MTAGMPQPIDAWTQYWRTGRATSCFEGADVEVHLTRLWGDLVDDLPDGTRLLDLATGNGTVARSCAARARARGIKLHIEAIDAAAIHPESFVSDPQQLLGDVRFHGGVRLEHLPFADGTFDAVVSQFGFEYADEEQATTETARILAPGGRLRLVMHARDGAVARDIGTRLERLHSVLSEEGPATLVLALARAAEAGDVAALRSKSALLPAAVELIRRLADRPPTDDAALFYSREFLQVWAQRDRYWPADLRRSLEQGWANAAGVAVRQEAMLRAARSREDIERIRLRFAAADLIIDAIQAIRDDCRNVQIAWMIEARKGSASRR